MTFKSESQCQSYQVTFPRDVRRMRFLLVRFQLPYLLLKVQTEHLSYQPAVPASPVSPSLALSLATLWSAMYLPNFPEFRAIPFRYVRRFTPILAWTLQTRSDLTPTPTVPSQRRDHHRRSTRHQRHRQAANHASRRLPEPNLLSRWLLPGRQHHAPCR